MKKSNGEKVARPRWGNQCDSGQNMRFIAQRLRFWASLTTWPTFGKGWAIRAAKDLEFAAEDN